MTIIMNGPVSVSSTVHILYGMVEVMKGTAFIFWTYSDGGLTAAQHDGVTNRIRKLTVDMVTLNE